MPSSTSAQVAAQLAEAQRRLLTTSAGTACQQAPDLWPEGLASCFALVEVHLVTLRLAFLLGRPELFHAHVTWLLSVLEPGDTGKRQVVVTLLALREALSASLPPEATRAVAPLMGKALEGLEPGVVPSHQDLLRLLLAGDLDETRSLLQAALPLGHLHLYERIIQPALEAVGELWQAGRASVADEHLATSLARTGVAALYRGFPWPSGGPRALLTCVEGELHDFGIQLLADLLALEGWDARSLGASTPTEDLVGHVHRERPLFVGLSLSMCERLPALTRAIRMLRQEAPKVRILAGGQAFRRPDVVDPAVVEADAVVPSASLALQVVKQWSR